MLGSALSMDKRRSKWIWERLGIPTAPFRVIEAEADTAAGNFRDRVDGLAPPLFVKPTGLGSSIGISKVEDSALLGNTATW